MAQQTAVEQLEKKLKTYLSWSSFLEEDFEQAKQMEKEQLKGMYTEGGFAQMRYFDGKEFLTGEQYYNETYGNRS